LVALAAMTIPALASEVLPVLEMAAPAEPEAQQTEGRSRILAQRH
jgi:hypothetical protein